MTLLLIGGSILNLIKWNSLLHERQKRKSTETKKKINTCRCDKLLVAHNLKITSVVSSDKTIRTSLPIHVL